jgi:hypothetical protein
VHQIGFIYKILIVGCIKYPKLNSDSHSDTWSKGWQDVMGYG